MKPLLPKLALFALMYAFILTILTLCWVGAEYVFEGAVHSSKVDGWRLVPNKQSKKGRAIMAQNNRLHKAVKSAKGIHQHWVRIYGYWNDTKQQMNFK